MIFTSCQGAPDLIGNGRQEPPATSSCVKVRLFGKSDTYSPPRSTAPLAARPSLPERICRGRRPQFLLPKNNSPSVLSLISWRRKLNQALEDAHGERWLGFHLFARWATVHPRLAGPKAVFWAWDLLTPSATSSSELAQWDGMLPKPPTTQGEGGIASPPSPTTEVV